MLSFPEAWQSPMSIEHLIARNLDGRGVEWALNNDVRIAFKALQIRAKQLEELQFDSREINCNHCKWPRVNHRPPGCPCFLCGKYGHRSVDCDIARSEGK